MVIDKKQKINDLSFVFTFGKYSGKTISEILEIDPQYLDWVIDAKPKNISFEKEIKEIIWDKNVEFRKTKTYTKPNNKSYITYDNNIPSINKI